ncbi:MAG: glycosyltransferase [Acetobacteraceae bacterium]|nr:glycosyltransferase [Acetobacteraceae bacterium]
MSGTDRAAVMAQAARLWAQGRHADAVADIAALHRRAPTDADLALRLGAALVQLGRTLEAVHAMEPAAALAPRDHPLHDWLGRALSVVHWQERGPEAIGPLRARLAEDQADPRRHTALATALLSCGNLAEAWPHYARRWQSMPDAHRRPADPLQRPDPAAWRGRRVLLFAEQGYGDSLQFLRYVPLVMAAGAEVVVEVDPPLRRLAETLPGRPAVVAVGDPVPAHDFAVPLLHLPWAFGTDLASIPAAIPYFTPDPAAVAAWRARLAGLAGLKVGLVWAGDPRPDNEPAFRIDRRRSFGLAALAPLATVSGVSFVSLQKGPAAAQAAAPPPGMVLHDWTGALGDFAATAALMQALDLVISADTAPLHLAGALGRPVWLLDRYDSCWRWLREREDSPWYPTLRRFRQASPGDWAGAVARMAAALAAQAR